MTPSHTPSVAVVGASGFLGRALVSEVRSRGREALTVGRAAASDVVLEAGRPEPARLGRRLDAIVYLAQSRHHRAPEGHEDELFAVNVATPFALAAEARALGTPLFVYASTGTVYAPRRRALRESDEVLVKDLYTGSKVAAEAALRGLATERFRVLILRPFALYGAGQTGMMISNLACAVHEGRPVTLPAEGGGLRFNPLEVTDAARIVADLLMSPTRPSEILNLAGPETIDIRGLAVRLGSALGKTPNIQRTASPRPGFRVIGDTARLREILGRPWKVSLDRGLEGVARSLRSTSTTLPV